MIKKHTHRKQNRAILKLPKQARGMDDEKKSLDSSNYESEDDYDKSSLVRRKNQSGSKGSVIGDSASTYSKQTESISSS